MINNSNKLATTIFIALAFLGRSLAQDIISSDVSVEIHRVFPYISITETDLQDAKTIRDLNTNHKSSWIWDYLSVEVLVNSEGKILKAQGKNSVLTREQKNIIIEADTGSEIEVKVKYLPDNTLSYNDPKELHYIISIDPDRHAEYPGGHLHLKKYLLEEISAKIPMGSFKDFDLTAVKFTIDEAGKVINVHTFDSIYKTFENDNVDNILLMAISNMPQWTPAEYSDGTKVKQEFVLTVGNMENCVVNLLGIRRL